MTVGAAPRLIVTLPGRSLPELREEIEEAHRAGADWAELRVDRLEPSELARLSEAFPAPIPLLATYRSSDEGGGGFDDPAVRARVLEHLASLPFGGIDVEMDRDLGRAEDVLSSPTQTLFVSTHLGSDASRDEIRGRLQRALPAGAVRKVVVAAALDRWISEIAPLVDAIPGGEYVLSATGAAGPLSRVDARRLGCFAVYASLPRPGAGGGLRPAVEPSQIPVDRLHRFFHADASSSLVGLIGRPVGHSRSPDLFDRFFRALRREGLYLPLECADDAELIALLPALAKRGFRGVNVTHPFKASALGAASRVDRSAEICGVANCLTFDDGEVEARNTDLSAILRRLRELRAAGRWDGRHLAVLGAGGAARATLAAARELGARATVFARKADAAQEVARAFGAQVGSAGSTETERLVVHATTAGRAGSVPLALEVDPLIDSDTHVLDWVYAPEDAALSRTAAGHGGSYEDGWGLLVYQAAASYAAWWAEAPSDEVVRAAREDRP